MSPFAILIRLYIRISESGMKNGFQQFTVCVNLYARVFYMLLCRARQI